MDRSKLCITVDEAAELASVAPAVETEPFVIKPTASQIERRCIFITQKRAVIDKLIKLGMPKVVEGQLVNGELIFQF